MNRETHSPPTPPVRSRRRTRWLSSTRRAAGVFGIVTIAAACAHTVLAAKPHGSAAAASRAAGPEAIRPFHVQIPETEIVELRRRVVTTRWPDRETVGDQTQGVRLEKLQDLVRYWGTDYDWRKAEAKLNALPQFVTRIDGLDVHFLHVRSPHHKAMPLIITHGWPGSIVEFLDIIGPLTDPGGHEIGRAHV